MRTLFQFTLLVLFLFPVDSFSVQHGPGRGGQNQPPPRDNGRLTVVDVNSRFVTVQTPRGVGRIPVEKIRDVSLQSISSRGRLELGSEVMVIGQEIASGRVAAQAIIIFSSAQNKPRGHGPNRNTFGGRIVSDSPLLIELDNGTRSLEIAVHHNTRIFTEGSGSISDLKQGDLIMVRNDRIIRMPPRSDVLGSGGQTPGARQNGAIHRKGGFSLPGVVDTGGSRYDPGLVEAYEGSPFGFFDPNMLRMMHLQTYDEFTEAMRDLGVYWAAFGATFSFNWDLLQASPTSPDYQWDRVDSLVQLLQKNNIHLVGYIKASAPGGSVGERVIPSYPSNVKQYQDFVEAVVERYDGDGFQDMDGLKFPIKYWSIEDEPLAPIYFTGTGRDYAKLLAAASSAIKKADRNAQVVVSMVRGKGWLEKAGDPRQFMLDFFAELAEICDETPYDVLDQHWLGSAPETDQQDQYEHYKTWLTDIEETASRHGFKKVPIVNLELAGSIENDTAHAADLVKRHVYLLSLGVRKMFWSGIKAAPEQNLNREQRDNYFRNVTLIDGDGSLKPAYWSYMFIVRTLDKLDWDKTEVIKENDNGVFVYKFVVGDRPLWVVWSDAREQVVTLEVTPGRDHLYSRASLPSARGDAHKTYADMFPVSRQKVVDSELSVVAGPVPIFISAQFN